MLKNKTALSLSPLALLTLAACGGSGGSTGAGTKTVVGEKGPLNLATAFLDYNDDGVWQELLEPGGLTGVTGEATFSMALQPTTTQTTNGYDLKIVGSANTIDMSSNTAFTDSLSAPSTSTMVTPVTTIMAEANLTAAQVVATLGLPAGMDPLTFSSFDPTLSAADKATALTVEKAAQKVMAIVSTFATAAESSGASPSVAFEVAMQAVAATVVAKTTAYESAVAAQALNPSAPNPIVLSFSSAQMDDVKTAVDAEIVKAKNGTGDNYTAGDMSTNMELVYAAQVSNNLLALKNVVATITAIDENPLTANYDLAASKDIFSVVSVLVAQVKTATEDVLAIQVANTLNNTTNTLTTQAVAFTSTSAITTSVNNPGPTDMTLSSLTISEGAASLVVGTVTTTDTSDAGTAEVVAVTAVTAVAEDLVNGIEAVIGVTGVTGVAAVPGTAETGHTYSIVAVANLDGDMFTIDAATGVLSLKVQADYETKSSYTVAVKTTEAGGSGKSYVETFTIAVEDQPESGGFGISSDTVTYTDYDPTTSASINNQIVTTTTGTNVTFGDVVGLQLNSTNMKNLTDGNALTTGVSPNLSFTLDSVPTGSNPATVTATITDGTFTAGSTIHNGVWSTDGIRSGAEHQITLTVDVAYTGTGTTASITTAAGTATGSYTKFDGTSATFNINNIDADVFQITTSAVAGQGPRLDVKMAALYDAFVSGAGNSNMIADGEYHLNIATNLPLENAANQAVTNFSGIVELSDGADMATVIGTNGADTLVGTAAAEIFALGYDTDTVTTGGGGDLIVLHANEGRSLANIDTVTDFTNGTDKFYLDDSITFAELTIAPGVDTADTLVSITASGEYLMLISDVASGFITGGDFISDIA